MNQKISEKICTDLATKIRKFLYHNTEDDRFGLWNSIPDWNGYFMFAERHKLFEEGLCTGGIMVESWRPSFDWGIANCSWEIELSLFLINKIKDSGTRFCLQDDLMQVLRLLEKEHLVIKSIVEFEKSSISMAFKRSELGLTAGELKVTLVVHTE